MRWWMRQSSYLTVLDTELGKTVLGTIVLIIFGTIVSFLNPLRQKKSVIRYVAAIVNVISLVTLLTSALVLLPTAIVHEKRSSIVALFGVFLVFLSLFLTYRLFRLWSTVEPLLLNQLRESFRIDAKMLLRAIYLFIPIVIVAAGVILIRGKHFSMPAWEDIVGTIVVVPLIEEFLFRFLLPKLARDGDCAIRDYILFSVVFFLIHMDLHNLFSFLFSLYMYYVIYKTRNFGVTMCMHMFWNFCLLSFRA